MYSAEILTQFGNGPGGGVVRSFSVIPNPAAAAGEQSAIVHIAMLKPDMDMMLNISFRIQ